MQLHHGAVTTDRGLEEEAQILSHEVSSKSVIKPSIEKAKDNVLIYLKRFSTSVYSRHHAVEHMRANKATNKAGKTQSDE